MEELLNSVQMRMIKTQEIVQRVKDVTDSQFLQTVPYTSRVEVYDHIRKFKEEEKNRSDKENWIVNIMRNIRVLTQDQQLHIFQKTHEIMVASIKIVSLPIMIPDIDRQSLFLEEYMKMFENFCIISGQDLNLRMQMRVSVKQGNIQIITELLKLLLQVSRNEFKYSIDQYSLITKDKMNFMQGKTRMITVNERNRSYTSKKLGETQSDNPYNNSQHQNQKEAIEPVVDIKVRRRKEEAIKVRIMNTKNRDLLGTPQIGDESEIFSAVIRIEDRQKSTQVNVGYYVHVREAVDELDENYLNLLEYWCTKRSNLSIDEAKNYLETLMEKQRVRNSSYISTSCARYRQYMVPNCDTNGETEAAQVMKIAFDKINQFQLMHLCLLNIRPSKGYICDCQQPQFKVQLNLKQNSRLVVASPSKGFILRKQVHKQDKIAELRTSVVMNSSKIQDSYQNAPTSVCIENKPNRIKQASLKNTQDFSCATRSISANFRMQMMNDHFLRQLTVLTREKLNNSQNESGRLRVTSDSQNTYKTKMFLVNSIQSKMQRQFQ